MTWVMVPTISMSASPTNGLPGAGGSSDPDRAVERDTQLGRAGRRRIDRAAEVLEDALPAGRIRRIVELRDQLQLARVAGPAAVDPVALDVVAAEVRIVQRVDGAVRVRGLRGHREERIRRRLGRRTRPRGR